jgi:hypothetical protein
MKTLIMILFSITLYAQSADTLRRPIAAFTPLKSDISHVSGLAIGIGMNPNSHRQVINGLNLEINPMGPFLAAFLEGRKVNNDTICIIQNGLHISTGGFLGRVRQNGLGISLYNVVSESNGMTLTLFQSYSHTLNGLHMSIFINDSDRCSGILVSGFWSCSEVLKGIQAGPVSACGTLYGLQVGIVNTSSEMHGVQVGLFNKTKKCRGLQIGLWNKNEKRSLPIINW